MIENEIHCSVLCTKSIEYILFRGRNEKLTKKIPQTIFRFQSYALSLFAFPRFVYTQGKEKGFPIYFYSMLAVRKWQEMSHSCALRIYSEHLFRQAYTHIYTRRTSAP